MIGILAAIGVSIAAAALLYPYVLKEDFFKKIDKETYFISMLLIAAAGVRLACIWSCSGHSYDLSCFRTWSVRLAQNGLGAFYSSDDFNNYPPGYMYVLWLIGKLKFAFNLNDLAFNRLLRIPALIIDIVSAVFIYKTARKKFPFVVSVIIMSAWLFNPTVILDSSLWGQVDIMYTFCICLTLYLIAEKKLIISYFTFALCLLLKPQSFIITPVLIYGIIDQVFLSGFNAAFFRKNLLYGLCAVALMLVICMPFGINHVIAQYIDTLKGSEYIVQNAFNFWGMLGKNYASVTTQASVTGYILIALSVAFSTLVYFKGQGKSKVYLTGGLLMLCTYMLSIKMNERYAFTVMMCFLLAFIERPTGGNALIYALITLSQFFNIAWVLFVFETDFYKYYSNKWICLYSAVNFVAFVYIIYFISKAYLQIGKKESK